VAMIVSRFAIIVGLSVGLLAMIVSPKTPVFASRSHFLCKPLQVGVALIDYLRSGRPTTPYREVFLTLTSPVAPFRPTNLYHIVAYWRHLAGITFPTAQRRGLHALRHTLATQLLQAQTPLHTIGDILGHVSVESTRLYAKADVEALRSVALELEEVSDAEQ